MEVPLYVSVAHTAHSKINSGIQRVTRSIAKVVLETYPQAELVEWFIAENRFIILDEPARKKLAQYSGPPYSPIEAELETESKRLIQHFADNDKQATDTQSTSSLDHILEIVETYAASKPFKSASNQHDIKKLRTIFRRIKKRKAAIQRTLERLDRATLKFEDRIDQQLAILEKLTKAVEAKIKAPFSHPVNPPKSKFDDSRNEGTDQKFANTRILELFAKLSVSPEREYILQTTHADHAIERFRDHVGLIDRSDFPKLKWVSSLPLTKHLRRSIRKGIRVVRNLYIQKLDKYCIFKYTRSIVAIRRILNKLHSSIVRSRQKQSDYRTAIALDFAEALATISQSNSSAEPREFKEIALPFRKLRMRIYPHDFKPSKGSWIFIPELMTSDELSGVFRFAKKHNVKVAIVFHDALPVEFPELVSSKYRTDHERYMRAIAKADCILPVSKYSEDCYTEWTKKNSISTPAIRTCPNGVQFQAAHSSEIATTGIEGAFVLCVSTLEPRKNHETLFAAWEKFQNQLDDKLTLVLVGNRYAGFDDLTEKVKAICDNDSTIMWLEGVSDERLDLLYRNALFTVFPSIAEGFGLPILESVWHGRPCICANFGAMAEAASEGGCLTTDTKNADLLANAIGSLVTDKALRASLEEECSNRPLRTWTDYALDAGKILSRL